MAGVPRVVHHAGVAALGGLKALTTEQLTVVRPRHGHALVSAVPGSGKTETLVWRTHELLKRGVEPARILVLMFNHAARDNFAKRLEMLQGPVPEVFTFHSFGGRLCRRLERMSVLLPERELVVEEKFLHGLARKALATVNLELAPNLRRPEDPEVLRELLDAADVWKGAMRLSVAPDSLEMRFCREFENVRLEAGIRTFIDLITDPLDLIESNEEVAAFAANRYDHILLDEFQDANLAQILLARRLAGTRACVMAVGDEDQVLYEWRGARAEFMGEGFGKAFGEFTRYALTRTFRFGHGLALLANHVISNNIERAPKLCVSGVSRSTEVGLRMYRKDSGGDVAEIVKGWKRSGRALADCAVLVREYSSSVAVEAAFLGEGIAYRLVGEAPFHERREGRVVAALAQIGSGGLRGKGVRVNAAALLSRMPLYVKREVRARLLDQIKKDPARLVLLLREASRQIPGLQGRRLGEAADALAFAARARPEESAREYLLDVARRLDLFAQLERSSTRAGIGRDRVHTVMALAEFAGRQRLSVQGLAAFLAKGIREPGQNEDCVLITSIHRSKGLDWPCVILPELSEARFPGKENASSQELLEAERRLFYVGVTRAKEQLWLICPLDSELQRAAEEGLAGVPAYAATRASRFLYEANVVASVRAGEHIESRHSPAGRGSNVLTSYFRALQ